MEIIRSEKRQYEEMRTSGVPEVDHQPADNDGKGREIEPICFEFLWCVTREWIHSVGNLRRRRCLLRRINMGGVKGYLNPPITSP